MKKTMLNIEENAACLLCYLLGWVSGLVIILVEKKNQTVRFHAMQSIIIFGALSVINLVMGSMFVGMYFIVGLINLAGLVLWIVLMVKAYQKEKFTLPVVTGLAEQWVKKVKA